MLAYLYIASIYDEGLPEADDPLSRFVLQYVPYAFVVSSFRLIMIFHIQYFHSFRFDRDDVLFFRFESTVYC